MASTISKGSGKMASSSISNLRMITFTFRYELYCASKAAKTTQCTVHCDLSVQDCEVWNKNREEEGRWEEEVLAALAMRYLVTVKEDQPDQHVAQGMRRLFVGTAGTPLSTWCSRMERLIARWRGFSSFIAFLSFPHLSFEF